MNTIIFFIYKIIENQQKSSKSKCSFNFLFSRNNSIIPRLEFVDKRPISKWFVPIYFLIRWTALGLFNK